MCPSMPVALYIGCIGAGGCTIGRPHKEERLNSAVCNSMVAKSIDIKDKNLSRHVTTAFLANKARLLHLKCPASRGSGGYCSNHRPEGPFKPTQGAGTSRLQSLPKQGATP